MSIRASSRFLSISRGVSPTCIPVETRDLNALNSEEEIVSPPIIARVDPASGNGRESSAKAMVTLAAMRKVNRYFCISTTGSLLVLRKNSWLKFSNLLIFFMRSNAYKIFGDPVDNWLGQEYKTQFWSHS